MLKKISVQDLAFWGILAVIFLIRLPPFYILPFAKTLTYSHNIARGLIGLVFLCSFVVSWKNTAPFSKKILLASFIGIYFFTQSLSIIDAQNIGSYMRVYKDFVLSIFLFFAGFVFFTKKYLPLIFKVLLATVIINVLLQTAVYFGSFDENKIFSSILREDYVRFTEYELQRGRLFGDFLEEIYLGILILFITKTKNQIQQLFLGTISFLIPFLTIASSWRIKGLLLMYSVIINLIVFSNKISRNTLYALVVGVISLGLISNTLSLKIVGQNIFDRLIKTNQTEKSITKSRMQHIKDAWYFVTEKPLFGIGLGNYYDNLSLRKQLENLNSLYDRYDVFVLIDDPHNAIFATLAYSGFIGGISFAVLLSYFAIIDLKRFKSADTHMQLFVAINWGTFIFALFNPWMYFSFMAMWWILRAFIEKLDYENKKEK